MENTENTNVKSISDYLPFGYLYLLLLGIASDSIYYGLLGINIISYSSVLDVLLSPIARLTSNIVFPLIVIVLPFFNYFYLKFVKSRMAKSSSGKKPSKLALLPLPTLWVGFTALIIFSTYMGNGIGAGMAVKKRLDERSIRADYTLTFKDNEVLDVRLVGNNSGYIFYIIEGQDVVTVSPIPYNVKRIEEKS